MEMSPSWEATSHAAIHSIILFVFYYLIHNIYCLKEACFGHNNGYSDRYSVLDFKQEERYLICWPLCRVSRHTRINISYCVVENIVRDMTENWIYLQDLSVVLIEATDISLCSPNCTLCRSKIVAVVLWLALRIPNFPWNLLPPYLGQKSWNCRQQVSPKFHFISPQITWNYIPVTSNHILRCDDLRSQHGSGHLTVAGSCEHGNEHWVFMTSWKTIGFSWLAEKLLGFHD
jgi:hypothetical protein